LNRQFGPESWTIYKGLHLFTFIDNHDVSRIASILGDKKHLPLAYGILFGIPGIPCIYYGSEWGIEGDKAKGDSDLRPKVDKPIYNTLSELIQKLITLRKEEKALSYGSYQNLVTANRQLVFERRWNEDRIIIAINADSDSCTINLNVGDRWMTDLLTGQKIQFHGQHTLPPYSISYWKEV
jgi:glycosidase